MSYDAEEHRYDDERYEQQSKRRRLDSPPSTAFTSLRLVAKPSSRSPLPPDQTLALLDPSSITSIGRDRAFDLRIRLKELAVSKTHATLFWLNGDGREESGWAIADCGSQHGTLVQRADSEEWERTSEPKKASRPFRLRHMDRIKICSTTFTAHIHPPCAVCAIAVDSSNLIPLSAKPQDSGPPETSVTMPSLQSSSRQDRGEATKRDLKSLKAQLLAKPHSSTPKQDVETPKAVYIDRAKIRRSLHGHMGPPPAATSTSSPVTRTPVATPPPSIESSRGYALLSKLSGPLGPGEALPAPVEARTLGERAGLGSREAYGAEAFASRGRGYGADAEQVKRRRWDEPR